MSKRPLVFHLLRKALLHSPILPLHIVILPLYFWALLLNGSTNGRNLAARRSCRGLHEGPSAGEIHSTHFGGDHQRASISKHQGQLLQNELEIFRKFSLLLTCSLGSGFFSDCCNLCKFFPRTGTIPASDGLFGLLGHVCLGVPDPPVSAFDDLFGLLGYVCFGLPDPPGSASADPFDLCATSKWFQIQRRRL